MPDPPRLTPLELELLLEQRTAGPQKAELEARIRAHADQAAQLAADAEIRDALRAVMGASAKPNPRHAQLAKGLRSEIAHAQVRRVAARTAAAAALLTVGAGLGVILTAPSAPEYVSRAAAAHETTLLRAKMPSQPETADFDAQEIWSATRIRAPRFPPGWRLADVQVYPASGGPSLEVAFQVEGLGPVSLFATRPSRFAVIRPTLAEHSETIVYWQVGRQAYALTGPRSARSDLLAVAQDLYPGELRELLQ